VLQNTSVLAHAWTTAHPESLIGIANMLCMRLVEVACGAVTSAYLEVTCHKMGQHSSVTAARTGHDAVHVSKTPFPFCVWRMVLICHSF